MGSNGRWNDCDVAFIITMIVKQRKLKCIECTNKRDELYDVPIYCTKFLKYDVATLVLGSRPRQRLTKVQAKSEARKSYFMFLGVCESVRE